MKKLMALLLVGVLSIGCAACGTEKDNQEINNENNKENETVKVDVADTTDLLAKIWADYQKTASEDIQFMATGGDYDNIVDGQPGKFDYTKAEENGMENMLCFPLDDVQYIDDAACMRHSMMVNNFTGAAYHVTDKANVQTIADGIKDATLNHQWMCGFPEKMFVVTVGEDYVISSFGNGQIIDAFKASITNVYGDLVSVVVDEIIPE